MQIILRSPVNIISIFHLHKPMLVPLQLSRIQNQFSLLIFSLVLQKGLNASRSRQLLVSKYSLTTFVAQGLFLGVFERRSDIRIDIDCCLRLCVLLFKAMTRSITARIRKPNIVRTEHTCLSHQFSRQFRCFSPIIKRLLMLSLLRRHSTQLQIKLA